MNKRYAIVRVDIENEDFKCPICPSVTQSCCDCKIVETYGDTKEQLILKITQVLRTKRALFGITDKQLAERIVEFLGVEE